MKKTMIALAAIAAVGAASAQVTITGSTTAYWMNTSDNTSAGLVLGGASVVFAAAEDMGGGYSAAAKMELNLDGARAANNTRSDRSISLAGPIGSLAMLNTRSGGTQGMALVAPTNLWNDYWGMGAGVLTRAAIDALVLAVPLSKELTVMGKYLEGTPDGAAPPTGTSYVATAKWVSGPLVIQGDAVSTTYSDAARAALNTVTATRRIAITSPRTQSYSASGTYNAGFANFGLGYDSPRRGFQEGTDQGAVLASFSAPLGATNVGLNYGLRDGQTIIQLGAAYSLSKRTTLNASWGQYTNEATAAGAAVPAVVESALSLSHSF